MPTATAPTVQPKSSEQSLQTLNIVKEILIDAPAGVTWESVLEEIGPAFAMPDGTSLKMKLEAWPGGRYFRDLGNNTGHLWGHVQVIKPPAVLEIVGPMFMSYAAASHVQYRLTAEGNKTRLKLTHTAIGLIDPETIKDMQGGWQMILERIAKACEKRAKK